MKLKCVSSIANGFTEGREYEVFSQETTPNGDVYYKMVSEYPLAEGALYPLEGGLWKFEVVEESTSDPSKSDRSSADVCKLYPKYYKDVSGIDSLDVYGVHKLFSVDDSSGAIQHASKKLLLSGVRTGGKSKWDDIREARDTLNRWLELNKED